MGTFWESWSPNPQQQAILSQIASYGQQVKASGRPITSASDPTFQRLLRAYGQSIGGEITPDQYQAFMTSFAGDDSHSPTNNGAGGPWAGSADQVLPNAIKVGAEMYGGASVANGAGAAGSSAGGSSPAEWAQGSTTVGGASAGGGGSNFLDLAQRLSPILGGAAGASQKTNEANDATDLSAARLGMQAPGNRLATSIRAALASAPPSQAQWGGPGSGLRGQTVNYTGGAATPLPPETKQLSEQILHDELQKQLTGSDVPQVGSKRPTNWLDDLLGGGALVSGIAGSFKGPSNGR